MKKLKNILAICLILFGLGLGIYKKFDTDTIIDVDDVAILNIDKPDDAILSLVSPISNIISDPNDRAKLAIFNQEFSQRILKYDTDNQHVNDVYVLAGKNFFKGSLANKYDKLDVSLKDIFELIISSENHELSEEEKTKIAKTFSGLAWALIQKK